MPATLAAWLLGATLGTCVALLSLKPPLRISRRR
jgi:hypothetical protein